MKICRRNTRCIYFRDPVALVLLLFMSWVAAYGQSAPRQLTPEEKKELADKRWTPEQRKKMEIYFENMTPEQQRNEAASEDMKKEVWSVKDLDQRMDAMVKFVKTHPDFMKNTTDGPANMAFGAKEYIKVNHDNSAKLRAKLTAIDDAFPASASLGKSMFESMVANFLLKDGAALNYAAALAQSSINLFHQDDYTVSQRNIHQEREQDAKLMDKHYVPETFNPGDAVVHFHQEMSARYATLGSIQQKLGKNDAARQSYKQSLTFHPDMAAYLGLAKLEEARGDKAAALQSLYDADLTGHLDANSIIHMKQMYAETHPGSNEQSLESLLDEKYKATFHNPVKYTPYVASSAQSNRTVLAELFTGAGCEPCMSPDLAFDAALHRYTRKKLVLLVYHDNAPDADPLANNVTEERAKYYATGGSTPHAFLDGTELHLVEGLPSHAQDAFDSISNSIDKRLDVPAGAQLNVEAKRHGLKVTVMVQGTIDKAQTPLVLHVDLLETEVSYSGENSLRLQPMVVRATAKLKKNGSGFKVSGRTKIKAKYTFDLKKIEAANLTYYSQFDAEVKKRTHGMFGAKNREYKNMIDPTKLAAVAFVQDDATKNVLQAAYTTVVSDSTSSGIAKAQ